MIKFKDFMNEAKTMKRVVVPGSGTVASMKVQIIPASAKLTKLKSIKGIEFFSANDSGKNKLIATNKILKKNYIYVVATGYDIDDTEWINIILGNDKRAIAGIKNTFENSLEDSILKIQQQNDDIMSKMSENINEKLDINDYEATTEKSKDGYRPLVLNIKANAISYLGVSYKTEEIALKIAQGYLKIMVKSNSTKKLDDFVSLFRDDLVK